MPSMPFKMSSLRHKKSKAMFDAEPEEEEEEQPYRQITPKRQTTAQQEEEAAQKASRKQAMQDFFKTTGANLKATGANLKASGAKIQARGMTVRKSRVTKQQHQPQQLPRSNRSSQRSLDIDPDVLDRLMGPPKPQAYGSGKIQSDAFLLNQRIRASSRQASYGLSPRSGRSQAEIDRKPLSAEEVRGMFVGAPYFNVEKLQGGGPGGGRPQVIFRGGDVETSARYGRDYGELGSRAFGACTMGLHRTRETGGERPSEQRHHGLDRAGQRDGNRGGVLELPSMLSANGLDPGTIGFEHFLQLPIADSTVLPDEPNFFEKRRWLYSEPEKLGLRDLDMEVLIDRLTELGELHAAKTTDSQQPWSEEKISEMGEDLFYRLLDPELGTTSAGTGSVTLRTQITALQRVLGERELWHDFSQVEWRIRVGQLLWASQSHEEDAEDAQLDEESRQPSERDVLLLQITLAAELLVRLDALKSMPGSDFPPLVSEEDRAAAADGQTRKIQWDVILAETFLENLTISVQAQPGSGSKATNRFSLFSAISFLTAKETPEEPEQAVQPLLSPKHKDRQLEGLLCFAETMQWPHTREVREQLDAKLTASTSGDGDRQSPKQRPASDARPVSGVSLYTTPLSSPRLPGYTPNLNRLSYFGGLGVAAHTQVPQQQQQQKRPGLNHMTTANSMQLLAAAPPHSASSGQRNDAFEVGGWLSRSWLTGLVLPGEPASHFLISTLLENSPAAIEALGDAANLYGGFVYQDRSFWSKSCVVGRVLAATQGARDCMGWVSVPTIPVGQGDGWVEADVRDVPSSLSSAAADAPARVKGGEVVAMESDPLHGASVTGVQMGDFTVPVDGPPVLGNEVLSHGLSFARASRSSGELTKTAEEDETHEPGGAGVTSTTASLAHLTFSSPLNPKIAKLDVPLTYDVHFIASYPCHPQTTPRQRSTTSGSSIIPTSPAHDTTTTPHTSSADTKASVDAVGETPAAANDPADSARASSSATLSLRDIEKALPCPPAHPLHINYHFDVVPVATLLSAPTASQPRPRALSSPQDRLVAAAAPHSKPAGADAGAAGAKEARREPQAAEEVVVLDCRGTADLELLARAWCAKVGENALVGKSGRTCLGCCVREARGLGVGVVLRT